MKHISHYTERIMGKLEVIRYCFFCDNQIELEAAEDAAYRCPRCKMLCCQNCLSVDTKLCPECDEQQIDEELDIEN